VLSGCDFGRWPEDNNADGGIERCDFSAATLDGCRFIECEAASLTFPRWPSFTILDPKRRIHEIAAMHWPGKVSSLVESFDYYPDQTVAVSLSAKRIAKKYEVAEEQIREVVTKLEGVIL
jgi:hypothetical protein